MYSFDCITTEVLSLNPMISGILSTLFKMSENNNLSDFQNRSNSSGITFLLLHEANFVFLAFGGGEDKQLVGMVKIKGGSVGLSFPPLIVNVARSSGQ